MGCAFSTVDDERPQKQTVDPKEQRLANLVYDLFSSQSSPLPQALPRPLTKLILEYACVLRWKFATRKPGLEGDIELLSDLSAWHVRPQLSMRRPVFAYVSGDTPLCSGRHAWRVELDGFHPGRGRTDWLAVGIVARLNGEGSHSYQDETFYGLGNAFEDGAKWTAGQMTRKIPFDRFRNGDTVEFLLDVGRGLLVAVKYPAAVVIWTDLPAGPWLPHFHLGHYGARVAVQILDPDRLVAEWELLGVLAGV